MKKIILTIICMVFLIGIVTADISSTLSSKVYEETINEVIYTFPTESFYCEAYSLNNNTCDKTEWENYKTSEVEKSISLSEERNELETEFTTTDIQEEEGWWSWAIRKIKELIGITTEHEERINKLEAELCKKDSSYSFCLGVGL